MFAKSNITFIISLFAALMPLILFAQKENDIHYIFTQTDSSYTFYGSFKIKASPDCLLAISFNFNHIRALAPDANEITLIDSGYNWNQISYTYRKFFFFENTTVWSRKLDKENQRVGFTLVSSENNQAIMPRLVSSSGYYQVKDEGEEISVEYFQQCQLEGSSLTKAYLNRVKNEAVEFMQRFAKYAAAFCSQLTSSNN